MAKKQITVTLSVKELVFDVKNRSYLTANAREAEGTKGYEAASGIQISDGNDIYQVRRSLSNAFSAIRSMLGEYLSEETSTSDSMIDMEVDSDGVLKLTLNMPGNYDPSSADSIGDSIHSYLVNVVLGEWFSIKSKEDAETYNNNSQADLESIGRSLYRRKRPARPTYPDDDGTEGEKKTLI